MSNIFLISYGVSKTNEYLSLHLRYPILEQSPRAVCMKKQLISWAFTRIEDKNCGHKPYDSLYNVAIIFF